MLTTSNVILLIIDVQGKLADLVLNKDSLVKNISRLIQVAKILGIPIIYTEQMPIKLGKTVSSIGDFLPDIRPIVKESFSCCGTKEFENQLSSFRRKQVIVSGIETHICVYQTTMDLLGSGYEVHVMSDAVSSRIKNNHACGLERVKSEGAKISSTEMAIFECVKVCLNGKFS